MEQRVALVTGGGSGIGRAAAIELLREGWHVVVAGRRVTALHDTLHAANAGDRGLALAVDVTDPASVRNLFDQAVVHWGRLDLLFNNAGVMSKAVPLEELSEAEWKQAVDTNLNGMFFCIQNAFRVMKAQSPQGGRIINNGSISSMAPRPMSISYTATKHAVSGLTKSASLDGRPFGIAVGQINVGNAHTDMAHAMTQGVQQANGTTAVEPVMNVSDIAKSVAYMANLPLTANVLFHTVMATNMPFIGRG
jgi:NAD(P)-dependent dehydrogenase (short-subunit alcohol dehydrogenase family)